MKIEQCELGNRVIKLVQEAATLNVELKDFMAWARGHLSSLEIPAETVHGLEISLDCEPQISRAMRRFVCDVYQLAGGGERVSAAVIETVRAKVWGAIHSAWLCPDSFGEIVDQVRAEPWSDLKKLALVGWSEEACIGVVSDELYMWLDGTRDDIGMLPSVSFPEVLGGLAAIWTNEAIKSQDGPCAIDCIAMAGSIMAAAFEYQECGYIQADSYRREQAVKSGRRRHELDPKRAFKLFVHEHWSAWNENPSQYTTVVDFAKAMVEQMPNLGTERVIARWVRGWNQKLALSTARRTH